MLLLHFLKLSVLLMGAHTAVLPRAADDKFHLLAITPRDIEPRIAGRLCLQNGKLTVNTTGTPIIFVRPPSPSIPIPPRSPTNPNSLSPAL